VGSPAAAGTGSTVGSVDALTAVGSGAAVSLLPQPVSARAMTIIARTIAAKGFFVYSTDMLNLLILFLFDTCTVRTTLLVHSMSGFSGHRPSSYHRYKWVFKLQINDRPMKNNTG
jgi:hypothetical protein